MASHDSERHEVDDGLVDRGPPVTIERNRGHPVITERGDHGRRQPETLTANDAGNSFPQRPWVEPRPGLAHEIDLHPMRKIERGRQRGSLDEQDATIALARSGSNSRRDRRHNESRIRFPDYHPPRIDHDQNHYRNLDDIAEPSQIPFQSIYDASVARDVTIHFNLPLFEDFDDDLETFSRHWRFGNFAAARKFFEENLGHLITHPVVFVQYAEVLLDMRDYKVFASLKPPKALTKPRSTYTDQFIIWRLLSAMFKIHHQSLLDDAWYESRAVAKNLASNDESFTAPKACLNLFVRNLNLLILN